MSIVTPRVQTLVDRLLVFQGLPSGNGGITEHYRNRVSGRMSADSVLEQLDQWSGKLVFSWVTSLGTAGAGRLWRVVRGRVGRNPATLSGRQLQRVLLRWQREDPESLERLAGEILQMTSAPLPDKCAVFLRPNPFCDRNELRDVVSGSGCHGFAGMRRIGKSALVQYVGSEHQEKFARRAIVDLDEFRRGEVLLISRVKRAVLSQVVTADIATDDTALDQQYRTVLAMRQVLLAVENVVGSDELRALVEPWPGALVLVTTRQLTSDLASVGQWHFVHGLDMPGARELLATCCPESLLTAEPGAVQTLLERFDRHPEIVQLLGGILAGRAQEPRPITGLLAELDAWGIRETDDLLAGVLSGQIALIPADMREAFRLLAWFPTGKFTVRSAEKFLGHRARRVVRVLTELGVLTVRAGGRYEMSWSLRKFVTESGVPPGFENAMDRLLEYYATRAVAADLAGGSRLRRYRMPARLVDWPVEEDRIGWLVAEAGVLAELVEYAFDCGRDDEVGQLCGGFEIVLLHQGDYGLLFEVCGRGVQAAERQVAAGQDRTALLARQYALRGRAATILHRFDIAQRELARAQRIIAGVDDPELRSSIGEFVARLCEEKARASDAPDWTPAIRALREAVQIDRTDPAFDRARGIHIRMLANVLLEAGCPGEALGLLPEAHAHTEAGDIRNASRVHTVEAKCRKALGELGSAREHYRIAEALAERAGARQYRLELQDVLGDIEWADGNYAVARSIWGKIAQELHADGHPRASEFFTKLDWLPPES